MKKSTNFIDFDDVRPSDDTLIDASEIVMVKKLDLD